MLGNHDGSRLTFPSSLRAAAQGRRPTLVPGSRQPTGRGAGVRSTDVGGPPGGAVGAPARSHARFPATREAPGLARRFVADALTMWDLPERLRDDVVLAVSELVSDAVSYRLAVDVELELLRRGEHIELRLRDACAEPPLRVDRSSGAGELARAVVDRCSDHWSWSPQRRAGREVRASFRA